GAPADELPVVVADHDVGGGGEAELELVRQPLQLRIVRPSFEQQDRSPRVLTQARRDDRAGRSCTQNDVVVPHHQALPELTVPSARARRVPDPAPTLNPHPLRAPPLPPPPPRPGPRSGRGGGGPAAPPPSRAGGGGAGGRGFLSFSVSDPGIGMTEEQLGRLSEAFSQAEASPRSKYGRTGLGLAISRHFCR